VLTGIYYPTSGAKYPDYKLKCRLVIIWLCSATISNFPYYVTSSVIPALCRYLLYRIDH